MGGASLSPVWSFLRQAQPVLTYVAGLLTATYISRRTDKLRQLEATRTAAYADFMRGVVGFVLTQPDKLGDQEHCEEVRKYRILTADAKARIAIYGSKAVVSSMADFFRGGSIIDSPERISAFVTVCEKMRADSVSEKQLTNDDLSCLFFDPR
jgi:hypothetical protein